MLRHLRREMAVRAVLEDQGYGLGGLVPQLDPAQEPLDAAVLQAGQERGFRKQTLAPLGSG
jgi:hypothetical protein